MGNNACRDAVRRRVLDRLGMSEELASLLEVLFLSGGLPMKQIFYMSGGMSETKITSHVVFEAIDHALIRKEGEKYVLCDRNGYEKIRQVILEELEKQ